MGNLKIVSLNLNNFGGTEVKKAAENWKSDEKVKEREERAGFIAEWILKQDAMIVVLQEFEISNIGDRVIERLIEAKFETRYEKLRQGSSVVVIAFKKDICLGSTYISRSSDTGNTPENVDAFARWIEVDLDLISGKKLKVIGIHVPLDPNKRGQFRHALANIANQIPTVIIGDFNAAGKNDRASINKVSKATLNENENFVQDLCNRGYIDAWRVKNPLLIQEYTWFYNRNKLDGRRLDYAFLSEDIELEYAIHESAVNTTFNSDGLSDHSALIVELKSML